MNFLEQSLDGRNQAGKYALVIIFGFIGGQILGALPLLKYVNQSGQTTMDFGTMGLDLNFGMILMLLPFIVSLILCVLLVKVLHKRSFSQTVNGTAKIRWARVGYAAGLWAVLMVVYILFELAVDPDNIAFQLNWSAFLPLVVVAVLLIPLQTTCEEYLLRGYFTQGVAGLTKSRWLAVLVPGLIFALMHAFNPEVQAHGFWIVMPQYLTFGVVFGLLSVLDDGIELAMGAHAVNNVFLCLFLTNKDSVLQTAAVFEQLEMNPVRDTISLMVLSVVFFIILYKKFHWDLSLLGRRVQK
ncbi:CPBP family intramembrane metalloprotease [Reichenbachiella carrageenanivorans]|uniref:CPBP family intramembrane metalloprotease n=1 Tax=Reichenbachiella carrageenanivorans TaxID=2979869 RepID=A0ABY6CV49_9BACT|nr:type II CAAX endopeptidase family protein [Reichenbachiella carrageenanivorans]UXX77801.1 CPBP family intramembrane metalloprotease [Reichenbachiella carrageenanivorans]